MQSVLAKTLISRSAGDFLQVCRLDGHVRMRLVQHMSTHTCVRSDMHTYAIGKARLSGVSQGRLRLKALIDCSYGVYAFQPHLSVCQRVLQRR